jgi:hypothetical protein
VRQIHRFIVVALLVLAAPAGFAQTSATRFTGTVRDEQGGALPGVAVTAASPSLLGVQSAISESNGAYQFPALPAGTYTLTFELQGFRTIVRDRLVLAIGQTLTVDTTLPIATLAETVIVRAESPVVDKQSTSVGNVLTAEKLTSVPTSTDMWGALGQAPGVRMSGFDVGGSHKIQSTGYDAFGIVGQVRTITEGVDTTEGSSGAGFYQDYFANSEVSVSAAGGDVTASTPGALVQTTVKSGGNQFKALINQTYEGRDFVGRNVDAATAARGFTGQPNVLFWETHGDLGGPVLRDTLWFFGSANHFHIDKIISGIPEAIATDLGIVDDLTTKETWKPDAGDTVSGYYQHQHKQQPRRGLAVTRGPASTLVQSSYAWMFSSRWQRVWSNRLFTEASAGQWGYDFPLVPSTDYRVSPPRTDLVTSVDSGAGFTQGGTAGPTTSNPRKPQVFASGSYFLPALAGSHDLKAGMEWLDDAGTSGATGTSGPILYLDADGRPSQIRLTDVGDPATFGSAWRPSTDANRHVSLYAQDRWAVSSRLTLTGGLRYDQQRPYYDGSTRAPVLIDRFPAVTTPGRTLFVRNNVAPRLGVSVDPTGSNRSVVKAFWGRYSHNLSTFASVNPGGTNTKTFFFTDPNDNRLYDGPQELGALVASTGGATTTLDPALKVPHTDEVDLSYQRQLAGESSIRVAYVRKMTRDQIATLNASWDGQFTVPVTIPVTLRSSDGGVAGTQPFTVYDVPASLRGIVNNVIQNVPASAGGGAANYDTIELAFNARVGGSLYLDSGVDVTWKDDLRSPVNTSNSPLTQADPIASAYFQNVSPGIDARQRSSVWEAHASSRYELRYGIGVGANVRVQSGWNYARVISVALPNAGTQRFWSEAIDQHRSPTVPLVNIRVDKTVTMGRYRLTGILDAFNVINSNAVTNFNLVNGASYNQINGALDPRTVQVGVRFAF